MSEFLLYLLESSICLLTFYFVFRLLLNNDTFFSINRTYIISSVFVSILLPLANFQTHVDGSVYVGNPIDVIIVGADNIEQTITQSLSGIDYLAVIYFTGFSIFAIKFLFQLFRIFVIVRNNEVKIIDGYKVVHTDLLLAPFSFFNIIFLNNSIKDNKAIRQIIEHEKVHINKLHSLDIILFELIVIVQWFNPIVRLYKNSIKDIHEFQADRGVIQKGFDKIDYQKTILEQITGANLFGVANNFNYISVKRRLEMLTKSNTRKAAIAKLIFVIPISAMLYFAFSCSEANELKYDESITINELDSESVPEFPGGTAEMFKYLQVNIKYPNKARVSGVEGTVELEFAITTKGEITDVVVTKSVSDELDEEAIRVVESMPKWKNETGKKVKMKIPVKYKLRDAEGKDEFIDVDDMPKLDRESFINSLKYPEEARKEGISGKVLLRVLVNESGKAAKIKVEKSDNEILNKAAIEAVEKTKFIPAKQNDKAVAAWITFPVVFRLDGEKK